VYTLSVSDDNFLLLNTCITYIIRIVANILLWHSTGREREEGREREREEKILLLNIKPINYVVTSTYTSDRAERESLKKTTKEGGKSSEFAAARRNIHTFRFGRGWRDRAEKILFMIYDVDGEGEKALESI
jgi:hypothetical protein